MHRSETSITKIWRQKQEHWDRSSGYESQGIKWHWKRISKAYWNCTTWRFIRKCRCPTIKHWRHWWRDAQIRNSDWETLTPELRELRQVQWLRVAGVNKGVERGKGECKQWKAKEQCSRGDKCSFRHDVDKRANPTPKTAPSPEPPTLRGRSASRKKNLRGRSPSGKFARQPCKDYLKCICTKSPFWLLASSRMSILWVWIGL